MYDYQKSAEAVLIRRAKRGDVKAFSELYSRIYVELYKFALYTLKHPQEAEDAVSDTVVTAYENKLKKSYFKDTPFSDWIISENKPKKIFSSFKSTNDKQLEQGYFWSKKQTWKNLALYHQNLYNDLI